MDKSDFLHYVNSVRWHCTILMKNTRLKEDIDRAIRGLCDIRPECTKLQFRNRTFIDWKKEHLNGMIDGFNELATLFERLHKSGRVRFN